jgi:hypothetical protein
MIIKQKINEIMAYQGVKASVLKEVGNQQYVWDEKRNIYYKLGEIGMIIWEYCQYPISKQQIISMLMDEYDVPKEDCEEQVELFINELLEDELLELVNLKGGLE